MYKPIYNMKRQVLVFRQFGNKGYSLFACLGREVVCSVLSVATLTYASAESVSTRPVVTDSAAMTTARAMMLEEVSVTGSRAPLTKSQAARMVTVLERADIAQAPVQSVNDLLKYAVGVDVRQRGPIGAQTDISIRGGTQDQIILLLNGINICDPQTGHNAMDLPVDLSEIVRIEVLEGPAGRVYGTSSLVGAINIVTRPAQQTSTDLTLEGGSYGYAKVSGRTNLESGRWNNQVSGGYTRSDGYSRAKTGNRNTDYEGAKGFYQGLYEDETVRLRWHLGIADKGWGSGTFWASPKWQADNQYEHTTKVYSAVLGEMACGALHLTPGIYWNRHRDHYEGYRNQSEKMKFNDNRTNVYGANIGAYFDWTAGRTALGGEVRNENLVSSNLANVNRTNISAYLEHNVLLKDVTVSAGFVAVKNTFNHINMTLYPGVDVSYRPSSALKLHASYNSSLRMPSFTEMYYRLQGYSADPHLQPEEMHALEAGFTVHGRLFTVHSTLWRHYGRNMIDWIMDTTKGDEAVWQSVNHARINSTGFETAVQLSVHNSKISINYSYIHQDKRQEVGIVSQYALEYLRHKLTANVQLQLARELTLGLNVRWQDRVGSYTGFDAHVHDYEPYVLTDAKLTYRQNWWKVYVEANNLFNTHYHDFGLVDQPGRWLTAGCSVSL